MNLASSISANVINIPVLNGTNFKKWKEHVIIVLGCMDLDYALREDRLPNLTNTSTVEQRVVMEKWERSNRMSLMIIKHSIPEAIRGAISEKTRAKTFLDQMENRFAANEKVETRTILSKLVSMRYKGKKNIREYIMEMSNLVTRLKALKLEFSEDILVHLVLISLPTQFSPFKISYNTQKEKWTLNELIAQCVQEEERLKQEKIESAHLVSISQGFGTSKKRMGDNKGKQTAFSGISKQKVQKKQDKEITCFFCKKTGHMKKTCTKYTTWYEKKGYSKWSRGFKFYDPSTRSFFETGNAKFIEDVELSGREPLRKVVFEEESVSIPIITTRHGHIIFDDTIQNVQPITEIVDTPKISHTQVMEPVQVHEEEHEFDMGLEDDPISVSQVKQSFDSEKWIKSMKDEMKSMKDNGVWDLVELLECVKPIGCKWIFKTKRDSKDSSRIIMALVAHYDLELHQMDVKTAFLDGNIDETIYMVQPENFESNDSKQLIYRDRSRGILGLSQNSYVDKLLSRFGMSNCAPGDTLVGKGDNFSLHQCPKNELEKKDMERFPYASAVGSLMYGSLEKGKTGYARDYRDGGFPSTALQDPYLVQNQEINGLSFNGNKEVKDKRILDRFMLERVVSRPGSSDGDGGRGGGSSGGSRGGLSGGGGNGGNRASTLVPPMIPIILGVIIAAPHKLLVV
ncbi:hypothetical protein CK203_043544 [Vitis vinifera]|uniref:CCHC-type domain-containing protein n=1 Tax=Vitis vinifera TaxID=29760 RepID=A0A438HRB9_VITVI|nr:hypothetical protein CK203_043544 [Vitis vinifera]